MMVFSPRCTSYDHPRLTKFFMGNLLYSLAVILVILWAIGFFVYSAGAIIHLLLLIAFISVLLKIIQSSNVK